MAPTTVRKVNLAFAGAFVLLAAVSAIALATFWRLDRDTRQLTRTYDARAELRALDDKLGDATSDARSFLLTGDSAFHRRHLASLDSAGSAMRRLSRHMVDQPEQHRRLDSLRQAIGERRASLAATVGLRGRGITAGPIVAAQLTVGERQASRLRELVRSLDGSEIAVLRERARSASRGRNAVRALMFALGLFTIALAWVLRRSILGDLTERGRIEAAVRESEAKFSGILSIAADAIISVDEQQRIVHFNRGAEEIFGYAAHEAIGQPLSILLPERSVASHHHHVASFAKAPETARRMGTRRQVHGRRRDGEEFPADASISKLQTPSGMLFTVVLRDVTEQKRLERHEHVLAEAGRRLAGSLDVDHVAREVASLPVPELGDWCLVDLIEDPDDERRPLRRLGSQASDPERDARLRAVESRGITWDSPSRVIDVLEHGRAELVSSVSADWLESHAEDGEEVDALLALGARSLLFVPLVVTERVIGAITIGVGEQRRPLDEADLALAQALAAQAALALENARLYQTAQRASAAREEVLRIVSHDLRNPLSAVSLLARTLLDHPPDDPAERRAAHKNIVDAADWMHRMMQDLLDAAAIDAGRLSIEREPQPIEGIVESALDLFAARAHAKGVSIQRAVDPALPAVNVDGGRIVQVLSNLVGNALKYTPTGGRIEVGAASRGAEVLVWVRDTGAGIAPEHLPRLFERFWHVRGRSRERGTGLGLTIAQGIVTAHQGRIWVESQPGQGSTFYFTLPVAAGPRLMPARPDDTYEADAQAS
ncbi:MAG TPA: ATP-binding protein [Gemmatimonadaceae bacterium]|nr:ATP-binding protein [Gemmatimonadaceae bacterium]